MNVAPLDEAIVRLGLALLHFIWQGALIGCLAAIGLALLRNARAQTRYAFSGVSLLLCLLLPVWQALAPTQWGAEAVAVAGPVHLEAARAAMPGRVQALSAAALQPDLPLVVLLWSLGAALMSLRLAMGLAWVRRLGVAATASPEPLDPIWAARLAVLAGRMGLRRLPRLHVLEGVEGPITVGRWRPLILLPASLLTGMPAEMLEALLAHELAHIRRLDYVANLVQSAIEVLLFYHPVVWWLSRRIRIEREQIADDLAAEALGHPRRLALALSELARWQSSHPPLALAAQGGSLMTRISRLVQPIRQPLGGRLLLPLAGLAAMAIAAHAAGVPTATPPAVHAAERTPAASSGPGTTLHLRTAALADDSQPFAFALISGDGETIMSGNEKDMREIKASRHGIRGDFLWVRQGAQRLVVTDPAALAEAHALFAPVHVFDAEMDRLGDQIDEQAEVVERVAGETEAAHDAPSAELEVLGQRMAALEKQREKAQAEVDKLTRRMSATRDEKQLAKLEEQQERLEKALEPIEEAMDALSEEMDHLAESREQASSQVSDQQAQEAEKALEELSRQMEALSQQQEAASQVAEEKLRALIQDLVRRGLAKKG